MFVYEILLYYISFFTFQREGSFNYHAMLCGISWNCVIHSKTTAHSDDFYLFYLRTLFFLSHRRKGLRTYYILYLIQK